MYTAHLCLLITVYRIVILVNNVYTNVYVKYFLIYPIGLGAGVWCARAIARIPIDVSLLRGPIVERRVLSSRCTLPGECKQVVQANCPEKSRSKPMFHRKLPPELGE